MKNYNKFLKENISNKGIGPGNKDLFPSAPKKQTINKKVLDFLRIGKQIITKNIDGYIDSVDDKFILIIDRKSGELKKYTLKEFFKEIKNFKDDLKNPNFVKGFDGIPEWAIKQKIYENLEDDDYEPYDVQVQEEQELEYGEEEEVQELEYGDEEYDDLEDQQTSNALLYGTEDNPEGLLNRGDKRTFENINKVEYFDDDDDDDDDLEYEVPIIRGTEDNPIPDKY